MAKIADGTLKTWAEGETVHATDYMQEREILRTANNDTDTRVDNLYTKDQVDAKINATAATQTVLTGTALPAGTFNNGQLFVLQNADGHRTVYTYNATSAAWEVSNRADDIKRASGVKTVETSLSDLEATTGTATAPLTVTLNRGTQTVTADRTTPFAVLNLTGRTLVNLLGRVGRTGTSMNLTGLDALKYYVVINSGGTTVTADTVSQPTPYKFTGKTSVNLSWISGNQVAVYEMSQTDYNSLTTQQIIDRFPYVDDVKHLNGVYINRYGTDGVTVEDYLYIPVKLGSNVDGSVADSITEKNGQLVRTKKFQHDMVLDGNLAWSFVNDFTGYKSVGASINGGVANSERVVKYDGKILTHYEGTKIAGDQVELTSVGNINLTIADTDSGWGETYTPTAQDIKDYFNFGKDLVDSVSGGTSLSSGDYPGYPKTNAFDNNTATEWRSSANAAVGQYIAYDFGSVQSIDRLVVTTGSQIGCANVKIGTSLDGITWTDGAAVYNVSTTANGKSIIDLSSTISSRYVRLVCNTVNAASEWAVSELSFYTKNGGNYKLTYQLAASVDEVITAEGAIQLNSGNNKVDLYSGMVVREQVIFDSSTKQGTTKYTSAKVVGVYKNQAAEPFTTYTSGSQQLPQLINAVDPAATYTVTYQVLDKYTYSANVVSMTGQIQSGLASVVDQNTKDIADLETRVSGLEQKPAQPPWIAPTLQNGWVNYGGNYANAGYYKDTNGSVHLHGFIKSGTTSINTVMLTLPAGYRPLAYEMFGCQNYNGSSVSSGSVYVNSNGSITIDSVAGNGWLSLDSISFRAEQ